MVSELSVVVVSSLHAHDSAGRTRPVVLRRLFQQLNLAAAVLDCALVAFRRLAGLATLAADLPCTASEW